MLAQVVALTVLAATATASPVAGTPRETIYTNDSSPSWSRDGHQILFSRLKQGVDPVSGECCITRLSALFVLNVQTGSARRVPNSAGASASQWSPDGTAIAFVRNDRVYLMRSNGRDARPIHPDHLAQADPSWSPDGSKLVFWRGKFGSSGAWFTINADGSGIRKVFGNADFPWGAAWSPDGTGLLIIRRFDLWLMRADGREAHPVTGGRHLAYYDPAWSPDGRRIAFRSDDGVHVIRADGTGDRRITSAPNEIEQDIDPAWSPDAKRIAFAGTRARLAYAIYLVPTTGGKPRRLTNR